MSTLANYNGLLIIDPDPVGSGGLAINQNFRALTTHQDTVDPTTSNDSTEGFTAGSRWFNTNTTSEWICIDNSVGAARWIDINSMVFAAYLSLSGGSLTGNLNLSGNSLTFDGLSSVIADGSGNLTFSATSISGPFPSSSTPNLAAVLAVGANASGASINMNDGSGSEGGSLDMDGGMLNMVAQLNLVGGTQIISDGSNNLIINEAGTFTMGTIYYNNSGNWNFGGLSDVNMNSGSGSGGGTLNMDGGVINGAQLVQLAAQGSIPTPVAGSIYFDGTHFYGCTDGATWTIII